MADARSGVRWLFTGREVAVVYALLAGATSLVGTASAPVLERPGVTLIAGFDLVSERLLPELAGPAFWGAYAVYLYAIAAVVGGVVLAARKAA